jgi:hypothetical protein
MAYNDVERTDIVYLNRKGGDMSEWPEDVRVREFPRRVNPEGDCAEILSRGVVRARKHLRALRSDL